MGRLLTYTEWQQPARNGPSVIHRGRLRPRLNSKLGEMAYENTSTVASTSCGDISLLFDLLRAHDFSSNLHMASLAACERAATFHVFCGSHVLGTIGP